MLDVAPSPIRTRYAFTQADEIFIDGRQYVYFETRGTDHLFMPADGNGLLQSFNNSQIARWLDKGKFEYKPARTAGVDPLLPANILSLFSPKEKARAEVREALVLAFQALYHAGEVKRTDASINKNMDTIYLKAGKIMETLSVSDKRSPRIIPPEVGTRSLRRWVKAYERHGIAALYDNESARGNYTRVLCDEERRLMYQKVAGYLNELRKTPANIVDDVRSAFTFENEQRRAKGEPELACPSRITIRAAIKSLDPFRVKLSREGKDAARRAYSPVGAGNDVERPLQRVEIDEQKIDLISLMEDSGMMNFLTAEEKKSLGLDCSSNRWWMTAALCVRTRCIIGMTLSRTPTTKSALQTVEMAMRDKGVWSDAAGGLDPWDQFGMIGTLVTDCGKQFISHEFRARMHDLGVNVLHTPAAAPWLKPYIERVFRTFSTKLMPRLSGCTFGDILRRGSSDPEANAALTVDQLCAVLVRWIVDIYHNSPHEGLHKETPRNCWLRLTAAYGVTPPPSLARRRLIFGQETIRDLKKDGITILGVRYHSRDLAEHMMHDANRKIEVRWYPEDIGAIWVKTGGIWRPINAVHRGFEGVSAQHWKVSQREIRMRHGREAEVKASVVQQALDFIERQNGEAMKRVGLVLQDWSVERIDEAELAFVGFRIADDDEEMPATGSNNRWGEALETATESAATPEEKILRTEEEICSASPVQAQCSSHQHPDAVDEDGDVGLLTLWDK